VVFGRVAPEEGRLVFYTHPWSKPKSHR